MLLLISPNLLSSGMFVDGMVYSCVANNMAHGIGSFWNPSYSPAMYAQFYEHPPLAMGMLALLYRLLGDGLWIEKAYALLMVGLSALLTVRLWKRLTNDADYGWLPLLLMVMVPDVSHFATSNMLEHTMSVFVLLAVIGIVQSTESGKQLPLLAAGASLAGALLVKGPVGLYPLALPLMLWIAERLTTSRHTYSFVQMVRDTSLVLAGAVAVIGIVLFLCPGARLFLPQYYQRQLIEGMSDATTGSRLYIVWHLLEQLVIPIVAVAACMVCGKRHNGTAPQWSRQAVAMLLLTLCGVLPMMLSAKLRGYYILTVYPYACIGMALLLKPVVTVWHDQMSDRASRTHRFAGLTLTAVAILANVVQSGGFCRDKELQSDMAIICPQLEVGEAVQIPPRMYTNYQLHAYYYRTHRVSLHDHIKGKHLLTDDADEFARLGYDKLYVPVQLPTQRYHLYERK